MTFKECERYTAENIDWLKMMLSKAEHAVITETSEMITECLNCLYNEFCEDKYKVVSWLDL